jgi:hypothetical protein
MIRNMHGMIPATGKMGDRIPAGIVHQFENFGRPPPEPCAQVRILLGGTCSGNLLVSRTSRRPGESSCIARLRSARSRRSMPPSAGPRAPRCTQASHLRLAGQRGPRPGGARRPSREE